MQITTIGLDLAKNVFQVPGINGGNNVVLKKTLRRSQLRRFFEQLAPCLVGIEACGTSHYWAREITKLGHEVRLMPPAYVKPYVKRGKTDAGDAEAICEAVTRPTMRYVAIKSPEQQAALALHRTRDLFVKQRTQLVNMIRSLLAEFGIEIRRGIEQALMLAKRIAAQEVAEIPPLAARVIAGLARQVLDLQARLGEIELELLAWLRSNDLAKRLATIPGRNGVRHSACGLGHRPAPVPFRTPVRRLARPDPFTAFQRRQRAAGTDLEDGRQVPATAAGRRHDLADPACQVQARSRRSLARRPVVAQASSPGHGCARQQGGAGCLGHHGAWWRLSYAGRRHGTRLTA